MTVEMTDWLILFVVIASFCSIGFELYVQLKPIFLKLKKEFLKKVKKIKEWKNATKHD